MKRFLFLAFTWLVLYYSGELHSQTAVVKGVAAEYAGAELVFNRYTDYISYTEVEAGRAMIGEDGRFEIKMEVDNITFVFSSIGVYRAYLFIQPGKIHHIVLPEKRDKTTTEKINPFFEEIYVHLAVENEDETGINQLISRFDFEYDNLFTEVLRGTVDVSSSGTLDSLINELEMNFEEKSGNDFFDAYRTYRYGFLRHVSMQKRSRSISDGLFLNRPVLYNNPAYMELFNQIYTKYFLFFGRTREGRRIYDDIGKYQSLSRLKKTLSSDDVLKDETLQEFVILKGLHDGFYSADFSRKNLLTILDSLALQTRTPQHALIATNIRTKVTRLMVGYEPPAFSLKDKDGNVITLKDFKGRYVYLNFCTPASYSCLSEFENLKWLADKHRDYLEIVTILIDENYESMQEFLKIRPYKWTFLFYGDQPGVAKDYDVRTFPTYYLVDRNGRLILSPAPSPSENFENSLFRIMRANREL